MAQQLSTEMTQKRMGLVNSDKVSDVTFLIGPDNHVVKAHKAFLVTASEVFESMFCGKLSDKTEIPVKDMERDAFLQVLKYCYGGQATFTDSNMLGILYGAEKYMLSELKDLCVTFILAQINMTNMLEIYNTTNLFDCASVNDKCMDLFIRDPMYFFEDVNFLQLSPSTLKKLVARPALNCTSYDLKVAIIKWLADRDVLVADVQMLTAEILQKQGLDMADFENKRFIGVRKSTKSGDHFVATFQSNKTTVRVKGAWLLGVGVCLGAYKNVADEMVKVHFEQPNMHFIVERKIKQSDNVSIVNVMFKKVFVQPGPLEIKVEFETEKPRTATKSALCVINHNHLSNTCLMYPGEISNVFTCLEYLIYACELSTVSNLDPITKKPIQTAMRNKKCNHVYDKASIHKYMGYVDGYCNTSVRCPVQGCSNNQCIAISDLLEDKELQSVFNAMTMEDFY